MSEKARLWTPIANAWDVYRRRKLREPAASYEHVWRLIHIHEAAVVTLGAALASRLLQQWHKSHENEQGLNRLRSMITGLPEPNAYDESIAHQRGAGACLSGSIQVWIDLLQAFGTQAALTTCSFCNSLADYLTEEEPRDELCFLEAWKRIAPVPSEYLGALPRVRRFHAINSLRNKLAHVPLPQRILSDLHKGLLMEVLYTLTPDYRRVNEEVNKDSSGDHRLMNWHLPLRGKIVTGGFYVTGSDMGREGNVLDSTKTDEVRIQPEVANSTEVGYSWIAKPFFVVDSECKVSLLFRIRDEIDDANDSYCGEYHRFAAEFEPIQVIDISKDVMEPWLPRAMERKAISRETSQNMAARLNSNQPDEAGVTQVDLDGNESPMELRSKAEDAFCRRDYGSAVKAFEALASTRDTLYNDVAKSKHGAALWRYAYLKEDATDPQKTKMIQSAVDLLKDASHHVDSRYQARSRYEMSKAYHKLWKLTGDGYLDQAYQAAEEAAKLDYQMAYITWIERLDTEKANVT